MKNSERGRNKIGVFATSFVFLGVGLFVGGLFGGGLIGDSQARISPPEKHQGLKVASLGVLPAASMQTQIGLDGYVLQLREITIAPGGAVAKHSHAKRPGLVWTVEGSWIEGRPAGDIEYPATKMEAILEDAATVHWFRNTGSVPARVVVCDIVPPS